MTREIAGGGKGAFVIKVVIRLLAASVFAALVSGCQTASTQDTGNSLFQVNAQGSLAEQKVAFARDQFEQGNYGLAEKSFREAVEATPKNGQAWLGLAAAYDQLGRFDLSDRAYGELLRLEGRKPSILNNQGYSYILRGDMVKARRILSEARSLAPESELVEGNWKLAAAS